MWRSDSQLRCPSPLLLPVDLRFPCFGWLPRIEAGKTHSSAVREEAPAARPGKTCGVRVLFEKSLVKQVRVAGFSFVLQAEEQVPEVYSSDALPGKLPRSSGAHTG